MSNIYRQTKAVNMKLFKTSNIDVVNLIAACNLTLNHQVLRLRNVVENLQISIGCVTMLFASHLYFVNMCQWRFFVFFCFTSSIFFVSNYCII